MRTLVYIALVNYLLFQFSVHASQDFPRKMSLCEVDLSSQSPFPATLRGDAARAFMFHATPASELEAGRRAAIQAILSGNRDVSTPIMSVNISVIEGGFKEQLVIQTRLQAPVTEFSPLIWEMDLSHLTFDEFKWLVEKNGVRERIQNGRYQDRGPLQALLMRTGFISDQPFYNANLTKMKMLSGPFVYMETSGRFLETIFDDLIKRFSQTKELVEGDPRIPPLNFTLQMADGHLKDGSVVQRAIVSYCEEMPCKTVQPIILEKRFLEPDAIPDNFFVAQNIQPGYTVYTLDLTHSSFMSLVVFERNLETMGYPEDHPLRIRLKYFRNTYLDSLKKNQH